MPTRAQIVTAARSFLGTPFHHCGRLKGPSGGIDCIGLLTGVCAELGIPYNDHLGYSRHPDGETLPKHVGLSLEAIPLEAATTGDVLTFWTSKRNVMRHAGILTSPTSLIHTWYNARHVVEHELDPAWQQRIMSAYRFPGVTD
jgi:NlpC/P60 family putative phage cell wall peptidase